MSRYLADGRLDSSFGQGGHATVGVPVPSVALQPDGRILSWSGRSVSRLTAAGLPDVTFGVGGTATLADGIILRAGSSRTAGSPLSRVLSTETHDRQIVRLTPDGEMDPSFGTAGVVTTELEVEILVDGTGRVVWVTSNHDSDGWRLVLHRLLPSGQPDPSLEYPTLADHLPTSYRILERPCRPTTGWWWPPPPPRRAVPASFASTTPATSTSATGWSPDRPPASTGARRNSAGWPGHRPATGSWSVASTSPG